MVRADRPRQARFARALGSLAALCGGSTTTSGVMSCPSRADWGEVDPDDLDASWALKTFLGKSFAEAEAMFAENALYFQEGLQSMPAIAFNFYAPALTKYLTSARAKGDADGASSFLHTLIWMLETRPEIIAPDTRRTLLHAAEYISTNQGFFDADVSIYGHFPSLWKEIQLLANPHDA